MKKPCWYHVRRDWLALAGISVCIGLLIGSIILAKLPQINGKNGNHPFSTLPLHDPIEIIGDAALDAYFLGNSSDGSYGNPYIIQNFEIYSVFQGLPGIKLQNISKYVIIQNCIINYYNIGIYLSSVGNCTLKNNTIQNCMNGGIILVFCSNDTIDTNKIQNTDTGMSSYYSTSCNFSGNIFWYCDFRFLANASAEYYTTHNISTTNLVNGKPLYYYSNSTDLTPTNFINAGEIIVVFCNNTEIEDINLENVDRAMFFKSCINTTIRNCSLSNTTVFGITVELGSNYTFQNNSFSGVNSYGVQITSALNCTFFDNIFFKTGAIDINQSPFSNIYNNKFTNFSSQQSIYLKESSNSSIINNTMSGLGVNFNIRAANSHNLTISNNMGSKAGYGLRLENGSHSLIANNSFSHNTEYGLYASASHNCSIIQNDFSSNRYGIYLAGCESNFIFYNTIAGNVYTEATFSGALYNQWHNTTHGNYWGDYHTRYFSASNDGTFWDTAYQINTTTDYDQHPLVHPTTNTPPLLDAPADVQVIEGSTYTVLWTLIDATIETTWFNLSCNGVMIWNDSWISNIGFGVQYAKLQIGTYAHFLNATDGLGGWVTDTMILTVIANTSQTPPPPSTPTENTTKSETPAQETTPKKTVDGYNTIIIFPIIAIMSIFLKRKNEDHIENERNYLGN